MREYPNNIGVQYKSLRKLGHPDYVIGDDGSVWRWWKLKGWKQRPTDKPDSSTGYISIALCTNHKVESFYVHRLVLLVFAGDCPVGMESRHLDGDRTNNRLINLKWGTKKENNTDKILHGTALIGSKHPRYRGPDFKRCEGVTEDDVREIRRLYSRYNRKGGWTIKNLAEKYKIGSFTMQKITSGLIWKWVK